MLLEVPPKGDRFPTTRWGLVAGMEQQTEADAALAQLCAIYWRPIYSYLRRTGHHTHDAQDITQEFFALVLRRELFARVTPGGGAKLRTFLLTALGHHLHDLSRLRCAQKRGSGVPLVSLDDFASEDASALDVPVAADPGGAYDRRWAGLVFERAVQRLAESYALRGKSAQFEILRVFLTLDPEGQHERSVAAAGKLGMSMEALAAAVCRLRKRFRAALRTEVAATVAADADVEDEMRYLRRSLF